LNHTNNNNKLLAQLLKNQAPAFLIPSSSKDPRPSNQPTQEDEFNQFWNVFSVPTKDDAVMADVTKEGDDADGTGEEWIEDIPVPTETIQEANATSV
jgi:hypothetical protein